MAFHEIQFPTDIGWGSSGGTGFAVSILPLPSGGSHRVNRTTQTGLRQYDAAYNVKTSADIAAIIDFYAGRQGPTHGFRYKDWADYTSASDHRATPTNADQTIGVGDGTQTEFQLVKLYEPGTWQRSRVIEKPVANTTVVALDGVDQTSGWSINTTTGVVLFSTAPAFGEIVTAGFEFDVPVQFAEELGDDVLKSTFNEYDNESFSGAIPLTEMPVESTVDPELPYHGGGSTQSISEDVFYSWDMGLAVSWDASTTGLSVYLPDANDLVTGRGYPVFYNSGSNDITFRQPDGTSIFTLAASEAAEMIIYLSGGSNAWLALT